MLSIQNLRAAVDEKDILKGVTLNLQQGEIHALMGPNGIGKSTLGHVLMASEIYKQTDGKILLEDEDLSPLNTTERAQKGLFLAFQTPVSVPGLKISEYLRNLYAQRFNKQVNVSEFRKILKDKLDLLRIDRMSLQRYLNEGFSGGEMKRFEMLQLLLLQPKVAFLDEIDSGLDVDAQKIVADCINYAADQFKTSFLIVTHYHRLLNFIKVQEVHIMLDGKISRSGDISLVESLEREGYDWMRQQNKSISTF